MDPGPRSPDGGGWDVYHDANRDRSRNATEFWTMKVFRITTAAFLSLCILPIIAFMLGWGLASAGNCALQFDYPIECTLLTLHIGPLLDGLIQFGVYGGLSFGFAVYAFAAWVLIELSVIILTSK